MFRIALSKLKTENLSQCVKHEDLLFVIQDILNSLKLIFFLGMNFLPFLKISGFHYDEDFHD